jgi:hypothetical protein
MVVRTKRSQRGMGSSLSMQDSLLWGSIVFVIVFQVFSRGLLNVEHGFHTIVTHSSKDSSNNYVTGVESKERVAEVELVIVEI